MMLFRSASASSAGKRAGADKERAEHGYAGATAFMKRLTKRCDEACVYAAIEENSEPHAPNGDIARINSGRRGDVKDEETLELIEKC